MSIDRASAETRLGEAIEAKTARATVVGLGFIGTTLFDGLVAAGFETSGYDRDPAAVERFLARGTTPGARDATSSSGAGDDPSVLSSADVVVVAVRALVRPDASLDLEPLKSAAALLRSHPRPARLVLVESTLPPGTTRIFAETWLADGCFVAHAPERLSVGHDWRDLRRIPHLVGGVDAASTRLAAQFLAHVCEKVVPVSSPEVSELSKLLENAFISVGVGLVGEITRISHALGISGAEVCEAAASKTLGYHPFYPGAGLGGHCLPNDLRILCAESRRLGEEAPLLEATRVVAAAQPKLVVDRLASMLGEAGGSLRGARVVIVGVGFKVGSPDTTETPARDVVRILRERGARPAYIDRRVDDFIVDEEPLERVTPEDLADGAFDAGIVLSGDPSLTASRLDAAVKLLLDAGGGRALDGALRSAHRL